MNVHTFIESLQSRGATLQAENGCLRVTPAHVLTDADRAIWREHKAAILQVLGVPIASSEAPPASTCITKKRIALASPTRVQWDAMNGRTYAEAELLRQSLIAEGVVLAVSRRAGNLCFNEPRLLIEYTTIASNDWHQVQALRAELLHLIGPRSPYIAEFDASIAEDIVDITGAVQNAPPSSHAQSKYSKNA